MSGARRPPVRIGWQLDEAHAPVGKVEVTGRSAAEQVDGIAARASLAERRTRASDGRAHWRAAGMRWSGVGVDQCAVTTAVPVVAVINAGVAVVVRAVAMPACARSGDSHGMTMHAMVWARGASSSAPPRAVNDTPVTFPAIPAHLIAGPFVGAHNHMTGGSTDGTFLATRCATLPSHARLGGTHRAQRGVRDDRGAGVGAWAGSRPDLGGGHRVEDAQPCGAHGDAADQAARAHASAGIHAARSAHRVAALRQRPGAAHGAGDAAQGESARGARHQVSRRSISSCSASSSAITSKSLGRPAARFTLISHARSRRLISRPNARTVVLCSTSIW